MFSKRWNVHKFVNFVHNLATLVQILAQEQTDSFQEVRTFKYYNKEFNNYE